MNRLLSSLQGTALQTDVYGFVASILFSFMSSVIVALLYHYFFENRRRGSQVNRFFLVGGPAITAMLLAIQFSLPLSLGLLGALSFVRFRTPIKEPEEVAYILLLIALSVTCATFNFILTGILLIMALIALLIQFYVPLKFTSAKQTGLLLLTFSDRRKNASLDGIEETVKSIFPAVKFETLSVENGLTSYHYTFETKRKFNIDGLLSEVREKLKPEKVNVIFGS